MKISFINGANKNSDRYFRLILTSALFVFLILQGCKDGEQNAKKPKSKKLPLVSIEDVQETKMVSNIQITGTVEANILTNVKAPADGVIISLQARENQQVKTDQIIAVIDPVDRMALISENRMRIEQLKEELKGADAGTEAYEAINDNLVAARENLEYAKNMYNTIPVVCPMTGVVTDRFIDKGSRVSPQENMFTIKDMRSLVIKAQVNEKYFEALEKGKKLDLALNAYPNDSIRGVISLIYPTIDPENRTVKFDIKVTGFSKKLLPGMMATIKIPVSENENALAVPEQAVLTSPDGKNFLFVTDSDSVAHRRTVQKGMVSGNLVEVKQGLKPGEKVVVAGQEMLKDGGKVKIMK